VTSLVSGGSRGLGLAIVERFLERGDEVATFSRSGSEPLDRLGERHGHRLVAERLDASDADAVRGFVARVGERFGRIDHCVANAAIAQEGVLATMTDAEIDAMLAVNLKGSIVFVREAVRQMLLAPVEVRGVSREDAPPASFPSIVVLSSIVAARGSPGLSVYAATKAGLEGFARSLARDLGSRGIRVNAVAPGFLETELSASLSEEDRGRIVRRTPLGRLGQVADIVGAVEFLASPRAGFITGQVITIDGGSS
jgi:3-oxoacyl-[acyl-carrier protein] reductase